MYAVGYQLFGGGSVYIKTDAEKSGPPPQGNRVTSPGTGAHRTLCGWLLALAFICLGYAVFSLVRFALAAPATTEDPIEGAGRILAAFLLIPTLAWAGGTTAALLVSRKAIMRGGAKNPPVLRGWLLTLSILHWAYAVITAAGLAIGLFAAAFLEATEGGEEAREALVVSVTEGVFLLAWCAGASAAMMTARKVISAQAGRVPASGAQGGKSA